MSKFDNFVAEFYSLKVKNYLNCWGAKFDQGKKNYCLYNCKYFKSITTCEY